MGRFSNPIIQPWPLVTLREQPTNLPTFNLQPTNLPTYQPSTCQPSTFNLQPSTS
ncbi:MULTISPECIES: hypothetical protein [unclassified Moorena]|uniref:hypothetical protein n=1 Tax=unclassified Moorena TaxID=2683338 RepID=UPI0013FBEFC8|nr:MULTISPECIES: hypothetical protein [unclassified Moorena]NEO17132.1 hypothetical protein [Moorena sp. SIO3E8]NEP29529.1 hypothetical protein [Moorena sp. SIO3I6]NEQ03305.1 hypothetical protein [Moorena sp. SIO3F7]